MDEQMLWETKRKEVARAYEQNGQRFEVATKPYHSTRTLRIDVVNVEATAQIAYGVVKPQTLEFFAYGVGDNVPFGALSRAATEADTNLARARSTNGAADFVIEGIGFACRGFRAVDASTEPFDGRVLDPDVQAALRGERPVVDPASMFLPPQVYSPFNLENAIFNGLLGYMSAELEWDRKRVEKLGTLDLFPQAGGASFLRSNGVPHSKNRYSIPEGYLWRRDGQPDSELICRVRIDEPVVIPITLNDDPIDAEDTVFPSLIFVDMVCRVFGWEFELPSGN